MESNDSSNANALWSLGFIFIILKLTGAITWSWWWVTVPIWGGIAIALPIIIIAIIYVVIKGD